MAKSVVYKKSDQAGEVSVNMTPLIDIVFQLIIFFILASQFASAEVARLSLPFPHNPDPDRSPVVTEEIEEARLIINVVSASDPRCRKEFINLAGRDPEPGELAWYVVNGKRHFEAQAFEKIKQAVARARDDAKEAGRGFHVEIRASASLQNQYALLPLQAAMAADVYDAHLVVKPSN
ncbi:MAG: biopolymer transporter ExbD [Phycisphaerae bacterium]|nr:biopolymer transporter ExbD [Phycisphaerae bacterium]